METPAALVSDVQWFPHHIDLSRGELRFVRLGREAHRRAAFLDDEHIGADPRRLTASIREVAQIPSNVEPGRCHFIFHSAFCCSTLLARAFDIEGVAMGLKEPAVLLDICQAALAAPDLRRIRPFLDVTLALLARPFAAGEAIVIKPSNIVNPLAELLLEAAPQAKAVLLYSPLPDFLRSVARKGLFGRIWARRSLAFHGRLPAFDPGYSEAERWLHTDLQVAALGWLQQHAQFARIARSQPAGRILTLDSRDLLVAPATTLSVIARLFEVPISEDRAAAIADGPIFTHNSKRVGEAFDAAARDDQQALAQEAYGEEIDMVTHWAEAVAAHVGIPMQLAAAFPG